MRTAREMVRRRRKKTEANGKGMAGISRQVPIVDANTILLLFWFLIIVGVFYWFYSILKRIEKTLVEIKELLERKTS